MATATTTAFCDCSSLANFNAWAQWLYNQILALGWVATADSGQASWPATGSVPTSAVYNIFKSADALSTAFPIYLKLEMWSSSNVPQIAVTIGTGGTNGSGTLSSPSSSRVVMSSYTADTTNQQTCYISGDTGSLRFCLFGENGHTGYPESYEQICCVISRSYSGSGSQTGDYVMVWWISYQQGGAYYQTVFNSTIGGANTEATTGYFIAPNAQNSSSWAMGGTVLVAPVLQNIGGLTNPTPDLLVGSQTDWPNETPGNCTVYGVSHAYMPFTSQVVAPVRSVTTSWLMRYE